MFLQPLLAEATRPGHWRVRRELIWRTAHEHYVVPVAFETDLASVPRPLRWLLDQNGLSREPAVLHDWLCRTKLVSRAKADAVFRRALESVGMGWLGRSLYWGGVRIGAGYNKVKEWLS